MLILYPVDFGPARDWSYSSELHIPATLPQLIGSASFHGLDSNVSLREYPGVKSAQSGLGFSGHWKSQEKLYRISLAPVIMGEQLLGIIGMGYRLTQSSAMALSDIAGTLIALVSEHTETLDNPDLMTWKSHINH